jgi:hypothetical protein
MGHPGSGSLRCFSIVQQASTRGRTPWANLTESLEIVLVGWPVQLGQPLQAADR